MLNIHNTWIKKTSISAIQKYFLELLASTIYKDVTPVDAQQYLPGTKLLDVISQNSTKVHILAESRTFKILFCTENFEEFSGYSNQELKKKNILLFFELLGRNQMLFLFRYLKWMNDFLKFIPAESLKEYVQIHWVGLNFRHQNGHKIQGIVKIHPFENDEKGLSRLSLVTIENISYLLQPDAKYWARIEAGKTEKYFSSFSQNDTNRGKNDILSPFEIKILKLIAEGLDNKKIAETLSIPQHSLEKQRIAMVNRLGARNTFSLLEICRKCNLI
jgi:DNA-binding CsgD family transcriptional regulator